MVVDRPEQPRPWRAGVVVLAGGTSRRFGGGDKTAAALGDGTVLDTLLEGLRAELPGLSVVVAGPEAGGGPAAALAAGCSGLDLDAVLALAGDQPFAAPAGRRVLHALEQLGAGDADGVIGTDPDGRRQPLLAAYRTGPLLQALGPEPAGRAMRHVLAGLRLVELPLTAAETLDVDTAEDLARARRLLAPGDT